MEVVVSVMAKLKMQGLEEYERQLLKLQNVSRECIGEAIYEGAGIVADRVKSAIGTIPIDERHVNVNKGEILNGISQAQKQGLMDGFGIARMQDENGYLHVKLGFDGYNSVKTRSHPNGQPNSMIARSVNSGSSFRARFPFVDQAVNASKAQAEQAMIKKFDEKIKDIMS